MRFATLALVALLLAPTDASAQEEAAPEEPSAEPEPTSEDAPPPEPEAEAVSEPSEPDVVVLTVGGDASSSEAREVRDAVARALMEDGLTPVPDGDVALQISPTTLRACRATECAWTLGSGLGVQMVAAVTAWRAETGVGSISVSLVLGANRSYSATEDVTDAGVIAAARAAVTGAQDGRRRALLVQGTLAPERAARGEADDTPALGSGDEEEADSVLTADRSLEEWILPSLLGVVGIGLVGLSVYALLDEMCDQRGPSGDCLRGDSPNVGLGILTSVLGGLSIAGAIIWLVIGGTPNSGAGNIDVVMGPDGGGVRYRARF